MESHDNGLSATQHHYLKRELLKLQVESEVLRFNNPTSLREFGYPFTTQDPSKHDQNQNILMAPNLKDINPKFPLTKFAFTNFLLTFPLLSKSHQDWDNLWVSKVQLLFERFMNMDISSTIDREEATKRKKIGNKFNSLLLIIFNSGIGTPKELTYYQHEQASIGLKFTSDTMKNIIFPTKQSLKRHLSEEQFINGVRVNISGVRIVKKPNNQFFASLKLTNPNETYYEFIVSSKLNLSESENVYVGRRYSDFQTLHQQLKKRFAGKSLPHFPSKITSDSSLATSSRYTSTNTNDKVAESNEEVGVTVQQMEEVKQTVSSLFAEMRLEESITTTNSKLDYNSKLRVNYFDKKKSMLNQWRSQNETIKLPRETTRVALRLYLRTLVEDVEICQSDIMKEFLNKEKIMVFTNETIVDMRIRENIDLLKLMNQVQFQKEAYNKIVELKISSLPLRAKLLDGEDGILEVFSELKNKNNINELSPPLRNFITWSEIEIAATIYQMFLANDNSVELFSQVKRLHKLMPYTIMYQILRITNPMLIMKSMIELLMVNPFGGKSLLQSIFYSVLSEDIKSQEQEISELELKVKDGALLERIKYVVFQDKDKLLSTLLKNESNRSGEDYLFVLLTTSSVNQLGSLSAYTEKQIIESYTEYKKMENLKGNSQEGLFINHNKAQLYSTLKQLLKLYTKSHDKAIIQQLWAEPDLTSLLKEIFTMFYQPLVALFRDSHVEIAFKHFEKFMDDMIAVISSLQENIFDRHNSEVIDEIMAVLQRHENNFYMFLNEVYKNDKEGVFDGIIKWINNLLRFLKNGRTNHADNDMIIDFETIFKQFPEINREEVIKEVDKIILDAKRVRKAIDEQLNATGPSNELLEETWKKINGQTEIFKSSDFGIHENDLYDMSEFEDLQAKDKEDDTDFSGETFKNSADNSAIRKMLEPFKEQVIHVLSLYK